MKERYGTVYKGSQRLIDEESGEVIEVDKLYRKQTSGNFVKAYIVQLISMLDMIGGKKLKIVNYILDNVHLSNNTIQNHIPIIDNHITVIKPLLFNKLYHKKYLNFKCLYFEF